ncbi:uncharacterized protein LOC119768594 [Culex quinquefasciatus]|uniref:uncharacterized protein LOC119768594 n=1 Tax=Culex quinquefasciatus TaxID=7176 RepID=UPI0018E3CAA7|nr:uncharacterized protein LOC119768594 [Culex quinquefasciatus]
MVFIKLATYSNSQFFLTRAGGECNQCVCSVRYRCDSSRICVNVVPRDVRGCRRKATWTSPRTTSPTQCVVAASHHQISSWKTSHERSAGGGERGRKERKVGGSRIRGGSGRSGQDCATIKSGVVRRRRLSSIAAETEGQCPGVGPAAAVNLTVSGSARNRATFRGQRRAGAARDLDIPGPLGFIPSFPRETPLVSALALPYPARQTNPETTNRQSVGRCVAKPPRNLRVPNPDNPDGGAASSKPAAPLHAQEGHGRLAIGPRSSSRSRRVHPTTEKPPRWRTAGGAQRSSGRNNDDRSADRGPAADHRCTRK